MDALQIIGSIVCFLFILTLVAIPVYQGLTDEDLFPKKRKKEGA